MVWGAIHMKGLIEKMSCDTYLEMLSEYFQPEFQKFQNQETMIFMHDGTSAHYALSVRKWLNENFQKPLLEKNAPRSYQWIVSYE